MEIPSHFPGDIIYHPIGIIHSPFNSATETPIQPSAGYGIPGRIDIFPEFRDGLKDLIGFSHIILIYHFHLSGPAVLQVKPYLDNNNRGLYSTRAPARPNPIGISTVRLTKIENTSVWIEDMDILDGTPLLDIKPYVPEFDRRMDIQIGWLKGKIKNLPGKKGDDRFRRS